MKLKRRGNVFYLSYVAGGVEKRLSLKTDSRKKATQYRLFAELNGILPLLELLREEMRYNHVGGYISQISLREAADQYLKSRAELVQNSTKHIERSSLFHFCRWAGDVKLRLVTEKMIRDYRDSLLIDHRKPHTINNYLSILNCFFRYCLEKELLRWNPIESRLWVPSHSTVEKEALSGEQIRAFLAFLDTKPLKYRAFFRLITFTGMRLSEARGFDRHSYIDGKNIIISSKKTQDDEQVVRRMKTKQSRRPVQVSQIYLRPCLDEYLATTGDRFPFETPSAEALQKFIRRARSKLGFHFTIHQLRHTMASNLVFFGYDIRRVMHKMGWSDMKTAARYTHVVFDELEGFDEKLKKLLGE